MNAIVKGSLFLLLFLIVAGCGGGGGAGRPVEEIPADTQPRSIPPLADNPLYYQQWYSHYDANFYRYVREVYKVAADRDAHIHPPVPFIYGGRGIKVAVIDDALDVTHEDLRGAVVRTYDVASKTEDVMPRSNAQNHGTEVTGVIAARSNDRGIAGIAPQVSIYFIRLPFGGNVYDTQIVEAFEKAKEWGVDIINCSWGSGEVSDTVRSAIVELAEQGRGGRGTLIVFAVGNGATDKLGDPIGNDESSIPQVLAVGASTIENRRALYSNYGKSLDLMAPGGEHVGLTTLDQSGYRGVAPGVGNYLLYNDKEAFAGTSAAAPIVTGVIADLLQSAPMLRREEIFDILELTAERFDRADCGYDLSGFSPYCGYGKVDLQRALKMARGEGR